jgi:hypothetical protein
MGWNGSGVFARTNGTNSGSDVWEQDKDDGTKIVATLHDIHDEDLADGIQACLAKNGENTPTANLPMGGYKHTGVGAATDKGHYPSGNQIINNSITFGGTSTGGANVYSITLPFEPSALTTGAVYSFIAHQNSTNPVLCDINGNGALQRELKDYYGAMATGSIKTGDYVVMFYNGTDFIRIPCNGPRLRTFTSPTLVGSGAMTISVQNTTRAIIGRDEEGIRINLGATFTVGGTPSAIITFTTPYATSAVPTPLACAVWGGSGYHACVATVASSTVEIRKLDGDFTAGALRAIYVSGKYPDA